MLGSTEFKELKLSGHTNEFIEEVSTEALIVTVNTNSSLFNQTSKNEAIFAESKIIKGKFV